MSQLPLSLTLRDHRCTVIGSGRAADRHADVLGELGARVYRLDTPVADADLTGSLLVVAATGEGAGDRQIAARCDALGIACHADADPASGSVQLPATIRRGPLTLAISVAGAGRAVAEALRERLDNWLPSTCGHLLSVAAEHESALAERLPDRQRARFWRSWMNQPLGDIADGIDATALEARFTRLLDAFANADGTVPAAGSVALIGAGPGDPELLTQRALRLLQNADVIVYDRLVSKAIMALVPADTRLVYAGKAKADHAIPQHSINQLLVDLATEGNQVVRLKGGDPFIFGRGGEEIETLAEHGVAFQVVPGITAASGCSAFSGIPLTHRDHAQSVVFVTGHLQDGNINLNWQELRDASQTIVVYMGLTGIDQICQRLIEHGRAPDTPAALVERGTTPRQRVIGATLATLPAKVTEARPEAPTLLIIGSVVSLRHKLAWFHPAAAGD